MGENHRLPPAYPPLLGVKPATWTYAPTRNQISNLLVHEMMLNHQATLVRFSKLEEMHCILVIEIQNTLQGKSDFVGFEDSILLLPPA